jgi:hypothetical protein
MLPYKAMEARRLDWQPAAWHAYYIDPRGRWKPVVNGSGAIIRYQSAAMAVATARSLYHARPHVNRQLELFDADI